MHPPVTLPPGELAAPPDHKQLPDHDGAIVQNFLEHHQSDLVSESLLPRLRELHPDGQFCIGCDSGIYWRWTEPVLDGCKAPDWFLVLGVPPTLDGEYRRSYVLWREVIKPLIVIEFVSGDGREEHDTTPYKGKFWVYEQGIGAAFYAIYDVKKASVELFRLDGGRYRPVPANARGRFPVEPLGIEVGIWEGTFRFMDFPWLRIWDAATGELVSIPEMRAEAAEDLLVDTRQMLSEETERAEAERKRADELARLREEERQRADTGEERARKLAEKLRALGIDPEA